MDYVILLFIDLALILEFYLKVRVALTYAGTPSFGHFGANPEGTANHIDQRFGLSSILPRILMIGLLSLFIVTLHKKGHAPNVWYYTAINYDASNIEQRQNTYPVPETETPKPYQEGDGPIMAADPLYQEMRFGNVSTDEIELPVATDESYGQYKPSERFSTQATRSNEAETTRQVPDMAKLRKEIPVGGSKYWLQTTSDNENRVYQIMANWQDQVEEVRYFRVPEKAMFRIQIGPFPDEASARAFRNDCGCSFSIVPE